MSAGLRAARLLPLAFCLLVSGLTQAQQRYLLEETYVAPGKGGAFLPAQADYCAAVIRGGAPECLVFSPTTFSPGNLYFTLLRFSSFAHYDEGTYTSKGMTPEQAAELRARREPLIRENHEAAITLHTEASFTSSHAGSLLRVVDLTIQPGSLPFLLRYVKDVEIPAAHAAGMLSSELYQVVAGSNTNRLLLMQRFDRFAQLDQILPFGDAPGVRKQGSIAGSVLSSRTTIMRVEGRKGDRP